MSFYEVAFVLISTDLAYLRKENVKLKSNLLFRNKVHKTEQDR